MPLGLTDLPLELLPQLLEPLVRRQDLCAASLVCRAWREVGQSLLFRWVRLFGRDLAVASTLFTVLAENPHLAALVRTLEVRVYPLSMILKERLEMEELACRMLRNLVNLTSLVWTRKGALTDRVFEAIKTLPHLERFELNAHTNLSPGSWDADHLLDLPPLRSISLILPDRNIANALPSFLTRQRERAGSDDEPLRLEEFSFLCRESTIISDKIVSSLTPALSRSNLHSLAFAGCSKLSGASLLPLLPELPHLRNLALEACNLDPSFFTLAASSLTRLHSLKLTHPGPRHPTLPAFFPALENLLEQMKELTAFTLYHSGASSTGRREWPVLPESFVEHLSETVGPRLRKFEVSGVLMSVDGVEMLTGGARGLRNFVLHLGQEFDLPRLTAAFAPLSSLRTLHILSQRSDISPHDVLGLAEQCHTTLRQIGFRNRVWIVKRTFPSPSPSSSPSPSGGASGDEPVRPKVRFLETAAAFGAYRRNRYGAEDDVETEVEDFGESGGESSEDEQE
ncbi:hypothetical protein JCM8547_009415 [Rhodosporidiobolus lusitaniae]